MYDDISSVNYKDKILTTGDSFITKLAVRII